MPPLKLTAFDDKSGQIGLPEGWKMTYSQDGTAITAGPNNEVVIVNRPIFLYESEQQKRKALSTSKRPYSEDVFTCFVKQNREATHLPSAIINVISTHPMRVSSSWTAAATIAADIDFQDGKGSRSTILRIGIGPKPKAPYNFWMLSYTMLAAPKDIAEQQMPTLKAIESSYKFFPPNPRDNGYQYDYHSPREEAEDALHAASARQAAAAAENQKAEPTPDSMEKAGVYSVVGP